jgi:hypothetical protein
MAGTGLLCGEIWADRLFAELPFNLGLSLTSRTQPRTHVDALWGAAGQILKRRIRGRR